MALIVGLEEGEDPADLERLIRRARAQEAVSRIRKRSQRAGPGGLGADEIEAEIQAARAERRG